MVRRNHEDRAHCAAGRSDLEELVVVHSGQDSFPLGPKIRAVAAGRLTQDLEPLGG